jgi:hypothetical protein
MPEGWERLTKINARKLGKTDQDNQNRLKGSRNQDENIEFY